MATTVIDNAYLSTKVFYETDLDTGPFTNVSGGAATVYSITVLNGGNGNVEYLKIYDTAEEITTNSTITFGSQGLAIVNGLTLRMVQGEATTSVDDPQANIIVEITYS